jgi:hypothetical protein
MGSGIEIAMDLWIQHSSSAIIQQSFVSCVGIVISMYGVLFDRDEIDQTTKWKQIRRMFGFKSELSIETKRANWQLMD